jgi:Uma2 family endonuclease
MSPAAIRKPTRKPSKSVDERVAASRLATVLTSVPPTVTAEEVIERIPPFPVRTMTVKQFEYLVELGFFGDAKVELLDGFVVDKMTHGSLASTIITRLARILTRALTDQLILRTQLPIRLLRSAPEPDLAVVVGPDARYLDDNPAAADTLLVIEVSDSTLAKDRGSKLRAYARNGIREYWIVNCVDRWIEIYTAPSDATGESRYKKKKELHIGETASVKIKGQAPIEIDIAKLFG